MSVIVTGIEEVEAGGLSKTAKWCETVRKFGLFNVASGHMATVSEWNRDCVELEPYFDSRFWTGRWNA